MREMRRRSFEAMVALLALAMSAASAQNTSPTADHPWIGKAAPPIDLPSVTGEGETVSLSSFRGKLVVLHFAASW